MGSTSWHGDLDPSPSVPAWCRAQPPPRWADVTATIACPIGVQLLSSPLHTLALDLYNRPAATHRAGFVLGMWPATFLARAARIVPAYSIGALINRAVRESLPR